MRVAGVILAGGLSRRMGGGDKSLKLLGGRPMLDHAIERLAPQVSTMALNVNGDTGPFMRYGLPVVPDRITGHAGPLAGVHAGMGWARKLPEHATHIVTAATDTPFFPLDLVARFAETAGGKADRIVLAASGGHRHPVFGLWPVALMADLEAWMGGSDTFKVMAWVKRHDHADCVFDAVHVGARVTDPFFNANTPEELAEAETLLREAAA